MFVNRARRRPTAVLAVVLISTLLLSILPAASVSAQTPLDKVYAYLRGVPGLKAQIPNLQVTLGTDADSPASWAAMGEVVLNKNLRNWFKPLVNGSMGWGRLPPAGAPVWATFIGLNAKPSLKGPASIVVHQGFGDGSKVVRQGPEVDPFEVDDTVASFGIWWREESGFYPLGAASTVGPDGVNWYDQQFRGAGGVSKKVMANVVPTDTGAAGGGGGNPPPVAVVVPAVVGAIHPPVAVVVPAVVGAIRPPVAGTRRPEVNPEVTAEPMRRPMPMCQAFTSWSRS